MVLGRILVLVWLLAAAVVTAQTDSGNASVYADAFIGKPTASGEVYDPDLLTAAHRTLRFGSRVEVTNPVNGKTVVVRINDRGPFVEGRILDLSWAAAKALGVGLEVVPVQIRVLRAEGATLLPTSHETYFQMGAFRTLLNAHTLVRALLRQGYEPRLRQDGTLFRVYLISTEADAPELIARLTRDGRTGFLQVTKEPSGTLLKVSTE